MSPLEHTCLGHGPALRLALPCGVRALCCCCQVAHCLTAPLLREELLAYHALQGVPKLFVGLRV
jgi:hypothetical protein